MRIGVVLSAGLLALSVLGNSAAPAQASPWAEVGDNQLRSDIQLLAAAGVVDDVTTHWPLPWYAVIADIDAAALDSLPASIRLAAARVLARARAETADGASASLYLDATNQPSLVYGFDGMGRGKGQAQLSVSGTSGNFSGRLSLGAFSQNLTRQDHQGHARGHLHVRPAGRRFASMPAISIIGGAPDRFPRCLFPTMPGPCRRSAFSAPTPALPVCRWFAGWDLGSSNSCWVYLDGPRIQPDGYYAAFRFTFSPRFLPGLEVGLARTEQFCGEGHPCVPLRDYFHFSNNPLSTNATNDEGLMDFKYSGKIGELPFQAYVQFMNEDYSPIQYSGTSHLVGASIFIEAPHNPVKLTAEYTSSIATRDIFSFGTYRYGFTYNNSGFPDGMRYRGRTLGFSLDNDSTLLSLQGSWTDRDDRFFQLSVHQASDRQQPFAGRQYSQPHPRAGELGRGARHLAMERLKARPGRTPAR